MFKRITVRLALTIAAILTLIIGLTAFLNYAKFEKIFSSLFRSRLDFVLTDLKDTIEFSLTLGLPLSDLKNTQDLIDQARSGDDQILGLTVYDAEGIIRFSTAKDRIGGPADEAWRRQPATSAGPWTLPEETALNMGISLRNAIDQVSGTLVLSYARTYYDSVLKEVRTDILRAGLLIVAGMSLLALLISVGMLRKTIRQFIRIDHLLRDALRGIEKPSPAGASPLEKRFMDARGRFLSAMTEMNAIQATLKTEEPRTDDRT